MSTIRTGAQTDAQRDTLAAALLAALRQLDVRDSHGLVINVVWRNGSVSTGYVGHGGKDQAVMTDVVAQLPEMLRDWVDNMDDDSISVGVLAPITSREDN